MGNILRNMREANEMRRKVLAEETNQKIPDFMRNLTEMVTRTSPHEICEQVIDDKAEEISVHDQMEIHRLIFELKEDITQNKIPCDDLRYYQRLYEVMENLSEKAIYHLICYHKKVAFEFYIRGQIPEVYLKKVRDRRRENMRKCTVSNLHLHEAKKYEKIDEYGELMWIDINRIVYTGVFCFDPRHSEDHIWRNSRILRRRMIPIDDERETDLCNKNVSTEI
jgi:hypothetical protein